MSKLKKSNDISSNQQFRYIAFAASLMRSLKTKQKVQAENL